MTSLRSLTPDESQQAFRACLDALAHPGRTVALDTAALPDGRHSTLIPMLSLTDLMTPVATLDDCDDELRELAIVTGAQIVPIGEARWVLATAHSVTRFRELNGGSALHPEHGAIVCLQVETLGDGPTYQLSGPGIDGTTGLRVGGLPEGFVQARAELVDSPPCGVDFLLVAPDAIAAIPRTTTLTTTDPTTTQATVRTTQATVPLTETAEALA